MAIVIPNPTDNLGVKGHAHMHGVIASDSLAPIQSLIVDAIGNVGIANTTPTEKLVIEGNILTPNTVIASSFTSTTHRGVSPFIVTSNTAVENLNVDLLDGYHAQDFSLNTHLHTGIYQPLDSDLTSIAGLTATSGYLKKSAANTWEIVDIALTTIDVNGDATGSAEGPEWNLEITLVDTGVVANTYTSITVDTKGRVLSGSNPTTLSGYGITDAAPINSPTFTGTVSGISQTMVGLGNVTNESKTTMFTSPSFTGIPTAPTANVTVANTQIATTEFVNNYVELNLGNVDNTSDENKPISSATQEALGLKSPIESPTFTGIVSGITQSMVGLENVTNESKTTMFTSPSFTGIPTAPTANTSSGNTQIATTGFVRSELSALIDSSPEALDTLNELAAALGDDENFATTVTNALATKAPLNSPNLITPNIGVATGNSFNGIEGLSVANNDVKMDSVAFTGTSSNVARADHVHPSDTIKANTASPTFTGDVSLPANTAIGIVNGEEISYLDGVNSNIQNQIDTKSPIESPTFTGIVSGVTKAMVGLGNADDTPDNEKAVLTAVELQDNVRINLVGDVVGEVDTKFSKSANSAISLTEIDTIMNIPVGTPVGSTLTVSGTDGSHLWFDPQASQHVFFVAPHGVDDEDHGKSIAAPFASVRYAVDYATTHTNQEMTSIFIRTGNYYEQLPIVVPPYCAIVGDNQRSVAIWPKAGEPSDYRQLSLSAHTDKLYINDIITGVNSGATGKITHVTEVHDIIYYLPISGNFENGEVFENETGATGTIETDAVLMNENAFMFLMSNACFFKSCTVKGMGGWVPGSEPDNIETSIPRGVGFALNPNSTIYSSSPYIVEAAVFFNGGIATYCNGLHHTYNPELAPPEDPPNSFYKSGGNKSMLFHSLTVINDSGVGYWGATNGVIELVSCFTYYCYFGYIASSGGYLRSLNGSNSWGKWGTRSIGYLDTEIPVSGTVYGNEMYLEDINGFLEIGQTIIGSITGATGDITYIQPFTGKIYYKPTSLQFGPNEYITTNTGATAHIKDEEGAVGGQTGNILILHNLSEEPVPGASVQFGSIESSYIVSTVTGEYLDQNSVLTLRLVKNKEEESFDGEDIEIRYKYSQVRLTGHDFLNIGTGGVATTNLPNPPSLENPPIQDNEVSEEYHGRVFYVTTDQSGNFRVGEYFSIDQATGKATLNASDFDLSNLESLKVTSMSFRQGETVAEFSSETTFYRDSNLNVPTEHAVKIFVENSLLPKAPLESPTFTGNVSGITKEMIGLENVENILDEDKVVYSASKLTTPMKVEYTGAISGNTTFDGSANVIINTELVASNFLDIIKAQDGPDSGLDADLLDGQHGSYYRNATNLNAGLIPLPRIPGTITSNTTGQAAIAVTALSCSGNANTASNADKLDGQHGYYYAPVENPSFLGIPFAPTANFATNTQQIATTAFVKNVTETITPLSLIISEDTIITAEIVENTFYPIFMATLPLKALRTYLFEIVIALTTGTEPHAVSLGMESTSVISNVLYKTEFMDLPLSDGVTVASLPALGKSVVFNGFPDIPENGVISDSTTLSSKSFKANGIFKASSNGILTPKIAFSANPTAINKVKSGSYVRITPI